METSVKKTNFIVCRLRLVPVTKEDILKERTNHLYYMFKNNNILQRKTFFLKNMKIMIFLCCCLLFFLQDIFLHIYLVYTPLTPFYIVLHIQTVYSVSFRLKKLFLR